MTRPIIKRIRAEAYELWLKALRSGKFTQGYGELRNGRGGVTRHCCLGVLCELIAEDGGPQFDSYGLFMGDEAELTPPVLKFMGLSDTQEQSLIRRNDECQPFKQIADHIEHSIMPKALRRP